MTFRGRIRTVNGVKHYTFIHNGKEYESLHDLLKEVYGKHGYLYEDVGISWKDAELAGYHPEHDDFSMECDGFSRFIKNGGTVVIEETEKEFGILELLEELFPDEWGMGEK